MTNLYNNIKQRRLQMGLSQEELAKRTGYTDRTSISKIEAGRVDLPQSKIAEFARALSTTTRELMGVEECVEHAGCHYISNVDVLWQEFKNCLELTSEELQKIKSFTDFIIAQRIPHI